MIFRFLATITIFFYFLTDQACARPVVLRVPLSDPPVSLDWDGPATMSEAPLILNLCEGLFKYDPTTGKLIPGIAESVKKSTDLKEYTFKIRKGAKWSDGRQIYAQDFVDSWRRLLSPQSSSIYFYYLFDIVQAKEFNLNKATADELGVRATNDLTLVVKLKNPSQNWEETTAFWPLFPVRKDLVEKFGMNWWRAGVLVSSGPFVFDSYESGKKITFKRNKYYPRGDSNVDQVAFEIVSDSKEALKKYDGGALSFLWGVSSETMKAVKKQNEVSPHKIMRLIYFGFNVDKFPMTNREFRLALLQAVDPKKNLPENAKQLSAVDTIVLPPLPGSSHSIAPSFNLDEAREHLKKSGVVVTKGMRLSILTAISEPFLSIGKSIQTQLTQNLGLSVDLSALQNQEYTAYRTLGEYAGVVNSWTAKQFSSQDFLLPYSGEAAFNVLHFKNSNFDQWMFDGTHATTPKEAEVGFENAQKLISKEEGVLLPLFSEEAMNVIHPKVKNLYFNHMGIPILNHVVLK